MKCRHCQKGLKHVFLDLGCAPPSNAYLSEEALRRPETFFPLKLYVCTHCWLVQTEDYPKAEELFASDYAYFSSTSQTWLAHAANYAEKITNRLGLTDKSFVIEIGSNDGYLLRNFVAAGIPCLGVEPTNSTADAAEKIGIPVVREFFSTNAAAALLEKRGKADLICANNVFAHVPDINDFTHGLRLVLKDEGVITLEFPQLMRLIEQNQFDTVYHEHFSYLSLTTVVSIFAQAGLRIFDVEELQTHGGSYRIYGCHNGSLRPDSSIVQDILEREKIFGLQHTSLYRSFQQKADKVKNDLLAFLIRQWHEGKSVAAYGAAAKGNTLMNYAGIKHDLIQFVCDAAPSKQGKFMPGSHIPIFPPSELARRKPDWVVIFPWNIAEEVIQQQQEVLSWGGKFLIAIPELKVLSCE